MNTEFYVLSLRDTKKTPAMCCVVEFEDVIIEQLNAELVTPGQKTASHGVLFVTGVSIYDIDNALRSIDTSKFSAIYAYVFDAIVNIDEFKKPYWRKDISRHYRTIRKITHLFVPFRQSVNEFEWLYGIKASYIPLGVDAVKHGGYDEHKIIDVNGYGRQPGELEKILSERLNDRDGDRIYHHTSHNTIAAINDTYAHRRLFWQQLRRSKIALAFDPMFTGESRFRFSFVPQRLFESVAAGCVIIGKRPTCHEMSELFNWPDAFIELHDEPEEMANFIEDMPNNYDLETIGRRNYDECLSRHDWRLRIDDMLKIIK